MKTIKFLTLSFFTFVGSFASIAQVSVGLDIAFPTDNFSNIAATGFGGSLRYENPISNKLNWTVSAGYLSFGEKVYKIGNVSIPFGNTTNIPLSGGLKYYFEEPSKGFYAGLDVSVNFLSTYEYTYNNGNGGGYNLSNSSVTKTGLNPGIGYRTTNWDFSGRYNALGDFSYAGFRIAYIFDNK